MSDPMKVDEKILGGLLNTLCQTFEDEERKRVVAHPLYAQARDAALANGFGNPEDFYHRFSRDIGLSLIMGAQDEFSKNGLEFPQDKAAAWVYSEWIKKVLTNICEHFYGSPVSADRGHYLFNRWMGLTKEKLEFSPYPNNRPYFMPPTASLETWMELVGAVASFRSNGRFMALIKTISAFIKEHEQAMKEVHE